MDFLTKLDTYQDYSKTLESAKEKLKNDIRFGKWGWNIIFHIASFDQTMIILILNFLYFGALKGIVLR